jgi:hypothetical protein
MRSGMKRLLVRGYCHGWLSAATVTWVFKRFRLQGA